jgi:hypothetical protein
MDLFGNNDVFILDEFDSCFALVGRLKHEIGGFATTVFQSW